jgi:hypothetical protein
MRCDEMDSCTRKARMARRLSDYMCMNMMHSPTLFVVSTCSQFPGLEKELHVSLRNFIFQIIHKPVGMNIPVKDGAHEYCWV